MNVEQAREVFHAAYENLFGVTGYLHLPHSYMPACENILAVTASWFSSVSGILFMWYQKLKVLCMVVFRDEGTFEPTTEMLSMGSRTNPLTWDVL